MTDYLASMDHCNSNDRSLQYLSSGALHGHRHRDGYLAVVIDGVYEEISGDGKFVCTENTVVAHPAFHWHANRMSDAGAIVLNIPCDGIEEYKVSMLSKCEIERIRAGTVNDAIDVLVGSSREEVQDRDTPELVRRAREIIRDDPSMSIVGVAHQVGASAEHIARQFRRFTGTTPVAFRTDCRVISAISAIQNGAPLSDVADKFSFADQSHLGREMKRMTGRTPACFKAN